MRAEYTQPNACRLDCQLAHCGDGTIEPLEACDEGAGNSNTQPNACRSDCTLARCGDGVLDAGEGCDIAQLGVSANCTQSCTLTTCGNGIQDPGETCDLAATASDTEPDLCRTSCQMPGCNDGVLDTGEACDNGKQNSDTQSGACRKDCTRQSCGDGVTDPGEECDGSAGCAPNCTAIRCGNNRVEAGEECDPPAAGSCDPLCRTVACGNGRLDTGEACEPGTPGSDTCTATCTQSQCGDGKVEGNEACEPSLSKSCTTGCTVSVCGNRLVEPGEVCDDGKNDGSYGGCSAGCATFGPRCGDAQVQSGKEVCDDGSNDGRYGGCNSDCKSNGPRCGDGSVQQSSGEECEPPNTTTCAANCRISCVAVTENCFNGTDDDCDGLADCADSDCHAGAVCAPAGSRVGVLISAGQSCPSGYTSQLTLHQNPSASGCSGCSCSGGKTQCSVAAYGYLTAAACTGDTGNTGGSRISPDPTSTCIETPQLTANGDGEFRGFRAGNFSASVGACAASGTARAGNPSWGNTKTLCVTSNVGQGCGQGYACVPKPASGQLCAETSNACTGGASAQTWYERYNDTRSCGTCSCTRSGGNCNNVVVDVGSDWGCHNNFTVAGGQRVCTYAYSPIVTLTGSPTNATCTPSYALSGSLTPAAPHSLCCN